MAPAEVLDRTLEVLGGLADSADGAGVRALLDALAWQDWGKDVAVDLTAAEHVSYRVS